MDKKAIVFANLLYNKNITIYKVLFSIMPVFTRIVTKKKYYFTKYM